jgi:putative photosynthetic complex assembly protein
MNHLRHDEIIIPRVILLAAGTMILVSLALVSAVRLLNIPTHEPDAPASVSRELRFEDRVDGGVDVIDAHTLQIISVVQGESGFLRGTVRSLALARRQDGHGSAQPFLLVARTDGRLTLQDPVTGKRIDLESFGPANAGVFAALLQK